MNTKVREISNVDDIIDVRDIIACVEELEPDSDQAVLTAEGNVEEWHILRSLLTNLRGYGGDEQWRGDWYPVTLIRDSYFVEAMQELCADIGDVPKDMPSYLAIDWEQTADNLRVDYSSVEFDGVTYWYR